MGQKTSVTSYRIANRLSWQSFWNANQDLFPDCFFKDIIMRRFLTVLSKSLGLQIIKVYVGCWKNSYNISNKVSSVKSFDKKFFRKNRIATLPRKLNFDFGLARFLHLSPQLFDRTFLETFNYKFSIPNTLFKGVFYPPVQFSSQVISNLIKEQIDFSQKLKGASFKIGLKKTIIALIRIFFNRKTISEISGIKVLCSGRWQKTKSSRKQNLLLSFGKIKSQTLTQLVDYHFSSVRTKYGVCGIKVWISYKNLK